MDKIQKLELTWIGKYDKIKLEPRILIEDTEKSYGDKNTKNMLIHGDNLLALKALEQDYSGMIKCVFIDPPYNTGNAFEHYDDGVEHSIWLNLMKPRIEQIHKLLMEEGSLWISIDDTECHYLKILCDEIFGRQNFIGNIVWEKKYTVANDARWLSVNHDHILVYGKNKEKCIINKLPRTDDMNKAYKNPDNHPNGVWKATPLHAKSGSVKGKEFKYIFNNGVSWCPPAGTYPRFSEESLARMDANNEIWFGKEGKGIPSRKTFLSNLKQDGIPCNTFWKYQDVGHNHEAKEEVKKFNTNDVFSTPKPERLIQRIVTLASNPGDIVMDSFLGSGTTAAVAHKMNRKWIGIELGEHCNTHCSPRLNAVVDGTDQGGISKLEKWNGGGGFKFYNLAPSLLKQDSYNNWVINEKYDANMLAAAVAKQEGFNYIPDESTYWKQGKSTEKDYILTTTIFLTVEYLDKIHDDMNLDESLLICCKAYQDACADRYANITLKKIPVMLFEKCEFGKYDYNLNIINDIKPSVNDKNEVSKDE